VIVSFKSSIGVISFDMYIAYEADELEFKSKINTTRDNIDHILSRYNAVDKIHRVEFTGQHPVKIKYIKRYKNILLPEYIMIGQHNTADNYFFRPIKVREIDFILHATMYFYESATQVHWRVDKDLPYWLTQILQIQFDALKPIIIGTAEYYIPMLKLAAKATIAENAARRARIMRDNAEAILLFLGKED